MYSIYSIQLFCSIMLGICGLKFMGEFCFMMIKLCGFGTRKPNNFPQVSQISHDSDGINETRINFQEPNAATPLINHVCNYNLIFSSALKFFTFISSIPPAFWIEFQFKVKNSSTNSLVTCLAYKQSQTGILLPKLFQSTVRKNCSNDRENLLKFEAECREFATFLRSQEQFIQAVKGQNNFWWQNAF